VLENPEPEEEKEEADPEKLIQAIQEFEAEVARLEAAVEKASEEEDYEKAEEL